MEPLKHECGVAMIRLLKPLSYFKEKYGSYTYALDHLYLLMEKQHNRGQEAAGVGVVKLNTPPGHEYVFRERALGTGAIDEIFGQIGRQLPKNVNSLSAEEIATSTPFVGEVYMGHLRYSTTGRSGMEYTHPFLRRNNWRSRALMLCGNFNMTNVDEIFNNIIATGQHPRIYSDTVLLLEQIGDALDEENHRLYRQYRDTLVDPILAKRIEDELDLGRVLKATSPLWDGGYAMCGVTGSGSSFVVRDPHGIRPAFYYFNDEIAVVASERPVIQTVFGVHIDDVHELTPGCAILIDRQGGVEVRRIMPELKNERCSFERVYFSRGSDADIYSERKKLGANIVPDLCRMIDERFDRTVFSFIPNTAEVAFFGMVEELHKRLDRKRKSEIEELVAAGELTSERLDNIILQRKVRVEKVAIKDIKLRTFIAEGTSRNDLATHVYDITYGSVNAHKDTLVVIDDSIVRGTTLRQSILRILDRLHPVEIIVVSSSPQVRYPDYYGIDMPHLEELAAFRSMISLLDKQGRSKVIDDAYHAALLNSTRPAAEQENVVKQLYDEFTDIEIANQMAEMLTPSEINARVKLLFQSIDGLHDAVPSCPGDWYFSGNYPTPGGTRMVNRAFIDYYERCRAVRYKPHP
ncbi:MAG: amidophosphoribosyltransferase [Muribaculaceae bacterium]|jgi:amidophosphoribosyltransferase|nr:amidophosphoribosyltransferase [Muribaculaceae bacterium]